MNRHQKQKSREIKDIMRTDVWRKMSYKEAKRQWKKGIRAFPVGYIFPKWVKFDVARLGFDRERLRELGQAIFMLIVHAESKNMTLTVEYEPFFNSYKLRFEGKSIEGKPFGYSNAVTVDLLRECICPLTTIAKCIAQDMDYGIEKLGVTPTPKGFATYVKVPFPKDAVLEPCVGDFIGRELS